MENKTFSIQKKEKESIDKIKELFDNLKEKYKLNDGDILSLIKEETKIPITAFNEKLSSLETICKYLKENLSYSLRDISKELARDERNIWHTYNNASKKHPEKLIEKKTKILLPLSLLKNRKLSVLENIVFHLKESYGLTFTQISLIIKRNVKTVWTIYNRAKNK